MKIAITGHTSGLGKALYDEFPNTVGYSKSTGCNIITNKDELIHNVNDCDIFINNAYDNMAQVELLFSWFKKYKNTNKTIVVIGSNAADACEYRRKLHDYSVYKKALKSAVVQLQNSERTCRIIYISPSYIENEELKSVDYTDVVELIKYAIHQKHTIELSNLSIRRI